MLEVIFFYGFSSIDIGCSRWQQWWRINSHAFENPSTFWPMGWLWYDWLWGHSFSGFANLFCIQVRNMLWILTSISWSFMSSCRIHIWLTLPEKWWATIREFIWNFIIQGMLNFVMLFGRLGNPFGLAINHSLEYFSFNLFGALASCFDFGRGWGGGRGRGRGRSNDSS